MRFLPGLLIVLLLVPALATAGTRNPVDLQNIQVSGPLGERLKLAGAYILPNRSRLSMDLGWGADQKARWLETASLLARYEGEEPAVVDSERTEFLARQGADGRLFMAHGTPDERWGASRSLVFLTTYYQLIEKDPKTLDAAVRLSDYLLQNFEIPKRTETVIYSDYSSWLRGLASLYSITGERRFLGAAERIQANIDPKMAVPGSAPLLRTGPRKKGARPQWEPLSLGPHQHHSHSYLEAVVGLVDLYRVSGDKHALQFAEHVWTETVDHTMWASGGIPEVYGEPFEHNDETCSAVSWLFLNLGLFDATGDTRYVDVAEHVLLNHLAFDQAASGGFFCDRSLSREFHVDPANKGTIADECCSMSGPRGLLEAVRHAVTFDASGIDINFYVPAKTKVRVRNTAVNVDLITAYPGNGDVEVLVNPESRAVDMELRFRVPGWMSHPPTLSINGVAQKVVARKGRLAITRTWHRGDRVRFGMHLPVAIVRKSENGFNRPRTVQTPPGVFEDASILYGPLLLMVDRAQSGRVPEGNFRVLVRRDASGVLRLDAAPTGPVANPLAIPGAHFVTECGSADLRRSSLSSNPIRLYPLSEMTSRTRLAPDEYLTRFGIQVTD